jgi:hypothetical protein
MSPHHLRLTAAAFTLKSRRIRSARAAACESGIVVRVKRRGVRPCSPAARINLAMRLRPCRWPARRSWAWMRGAP